MSVEILHHIKADAKTCAECGTKLPWNNKSGLCKPHWRKAWYQENKSTEKYQEKEARRLENLDPATQRARGRRHTWKKLGLDPDKIEESYKKHDGFCDICGCAANEGKWMAARNRLLMDHNHRTMKHRGWLCGRCNALLGMAADDVKVLEAAIRYLNERG